MSEAANCGGHNYAKGGGGKYTDINLRLDADDGGELPFKRALALGSGWNQRGRRVGTRSVQRCPLVKTIIIDG